MKQKLTLTIESELLPKIKQVAVFQGASVSELVERSMKVMIEEKEPTFAHKWKGKFKLDPAKKNSKIYKYLAKKYQ